MKITKESNWHVKAFPGRCYSNKDEYRDCQEIESEINRHCEYVGTTEIECDTEELCEFCGKSWEDWYGEEDWDEMIGPGFCCDKAKDDYEKSQVCVKCKKIKEYGWAYEMHRCKECNEWFCKDCLGNSNKCEECLEKIRKEKEEKDRPPGRKVRL